MKIIHRYILRETLASFVLCLLSFTFILLVGNLFRFVDLFLNKGFPLFFILKLLALLSPSLLVFTLPMAQLVASITTYSRLNGDQELLALKTTGYSLGQLLFPNIFLAFSLAILTLYLTLIGIPQGNTLFRWELRRGLSLQPYFAIREKFFYTDIEGMVLYVDEIAPSRDLLKGIFLSDDRDPEASLTITAEEGRISINPERLVIVVDLKNGTIHRLNKKRDEYQWVRFDRYFLSVPMRSAALQKERPKKSQEMMVGELQKYIRELEKTQSKDNSSLIRARIKLHQKFSLPFVPLLLGFIGPCLGILNRNAGRSGGLLIGALVILLYYVIYTTGETLGSEGVFPPLVATWLPNFFLLFLSSLLLSWAQRDATLEFQEHILRLVRRFFLYKTVKDKD